MVAASGSGTASATSACSGWGRSLERECYDLVARSDIALIVYFTEEPYYNLAHPSKLSLYVAAATPIVAGDAAHIASFVREHEVGPSPRARTTRTRSSG